MTFLNSYASMRDPEASVLENAEQVPSSKLADRD